MDVREVTLLTFEPQAQPTLAAGYVVRHRRFDEATIWNMLRSRYPEIELVPIGPGTDLYTLVGAGCSYVKSL